MKRIMLLALAVITLTIIPEAASAVSFVVYCGDLPGCGSANDFVSVVNVLEFLLRNVPAYAYAAGVLFVMIGGGQMVFSAGREDWVSKGKTTITWAIVGILATAFAKNAIDLTQTIVQGRVPGTDMLGNEDLAYSINNTAISIMFDVLNISILGVAIFSGMRMVLSEGKEDQFKKGQEGMFWCAVGAVIINMAEFIIDATATI